MYEVSSVCAPEGSPVSSGVEMKTLRKGQYTLVVSLGGLCI